MLIDSISHVSLFSVPSPPTSFLPLFTPSIVPPFCHFPLHTSSSPSCSPFTHPRYHISLPRPAHTIVITSILAPLHNRIIALSIVTLKTPSSSSLSTPLITIQSSIYHFTTPSFSIPLSFNPSLYYLISLFHPIQRKIR